MNREWQAATEAGNCAKVSSLLDNSENVNSLDRYGQTALMNAACRGDAELVKLLVDRGANLNVTAKYNLTALMLAVINKHIKIVHILINAGADSTIKGSNGSFNRTPLDYAMVNGSDELVSILSKSTPHPHD